MAIEQTNPPAGLKPIVVTTEPGERWGRRFAIAVAVVFVISSAFPVAAGLSQNTASFPKWWGALDVGIAFLLAVLVFVIFGLARGKLNKQVEDICYRAYRIVIHGIFALILAFVFFGDRIGWPNCLPGFAWRYWLLLYSLPAWLAVARVRSSASKPSSS